MTSKREVSPPEIQIRSSHWISFRFQVTKMEMLDSKQSQCSHHMEPMVVDLSLDDL